MNTYLTPAPSLFSSCRRIALVAVLALGVSGVVAASPQAGSGTQGSGQETADPPGDITGVRTGGGTGSGEVTSDASMGVPPPPSIPTANPEDGPTFPISEIRLRYLRDNPLHPPLEIALEKPITLGETESGYVAPRNDVPLVTRPLAAIANRPLESYHASAIQFILERMRDHFVEQDILGVYVAPDPTQISEIGVDLRPGGATVLTLVVTTGIVTEMRTVASGERVREGGQIPPDQRIDNTLHTRIIERSPIRPERERDPLHKDLLRKSELDNYLFHLARHPGRRVDASVAAAQEVGGIALDYIVTENHPIVWYFQIGNTGTASTDYLRQRFGFFNTQFSFNDDILSIDYTTANFDEVNSVVASYEAPFTDDRVRWRVAGSWSEYNAEEVGIFNNRFEGESWSFSGEVFANIYQDREFFVDIMGGARLQNEEVTNNTFAPFFITKGDELFLFPYVGVRMERSTEWVRTNGEVALEWQIGDITDVKRAELNALGRTLPDTDWAILKWRLGHSVFLEPLLNREAWEDPSTPETSTLAHEINVSFRGQYAFDKRVIPQSQHVVGGLNTVRGYPESAVAGDTAIIGSIEYRYHLPRAFEIQPEPNKMFGQPFRVAPQYVYGVPDWDLVLRGFFDIGHVIVSDPIAFEREDETLYGAGVGLDFLYKRNINIRVDLGFALDDLQQGGVSSGATRLQAVATFMY